MVTIVTSGTESGLSEALVKHIQSKPSTRRIVIVPDRHTLSFEAEILEKSGIEGSFDIEVMSFSRLAFKYLKRKLKIMSPEAGVMLLKKVIDTYAAELTAFAKSARHTAFAADLYAVITDLRNNGIDSAALQAGAAQMQGHTGRKTRDIATIYRYYVEELQSHFYDSTNLLESFCAEIDRLPEFAGCRFYFAGFYRFSKIETDILKKLILRAEAAEFFICAKKTGGNSRIFPNRLVTKIKNLCAQLQASVQIEEQPIRLHADQRIVFDALYAYRKATFSGRQTGLYTARSKQEEAEFIAKKIRALVVEEKVRYRDIALICSDIAAYRSAYEAAFKRHGIPYFLNIGSPLAKEPLITLIGAAFKVAEKNFRKKEVFDYAFHALAGMDEDALFAYENYCIRYNIDRTRFLTPFEILDERFDMDALESIRSRVVESINTLLPAAEKSVLEYVRGIRRFLAFWNADIRLTRLIERQRAAGFFAQAESARQSMGKLDSILHDLESVMGAQSFEIEQFAGIFAAAVESVEISFVPLYLDSVLIGEPEESRLEQVDYLFVSGLGESKFPRLHRGEGILGLKEQREWERFSLKTEPDIAEQNAESYFTALQLFLKPQKALYLTYATRTSDGSAEGPSQTFKEMARITESKPQPIAELLRAAPEVFLARQLSHPSAAVGMVDLIGTLSQSAQENINLQLGRSARMQPLGLPSKLEAAQAMFRTQGGRQYTSISQIERHMSCPLRHFLERALQLREREEPGMNAAELGSLVHAVLELFFKQTDIAHLSKQQIEERTDACIEAVLKLEEFRMAAEDQSLLKILRAEAVFMFCELLEGMRASGFFPVLNEATFKEGGDFPEMTIDLDSRTLYMTGKIDRVDAAGNHILIIDYKSKSRIKFGFKEVLFGERIQLFCYLNAILDTGRYRPAGVAYLPLAHGFRPKHKKGSHYRYVGFFLDQKEVTEQFDLTLVEGEESKLFPLKKTLKGKISAAEGGTLLSESDFYALGHYVRKMTAKTAREIESGYIAASPLKGACDYCAFKNLCGMREDDTRIRAFTGIKADAEIRKEAGIADEME